MTTTPEPRTGARTPGPDADTTQPLPATGAEQPVAGAPGAPRTDPSPRLTPAQEWRRYEAAQREAAQQESAQQEAAQREAARREAAGGRTTDAGGPFAPPAGAPGVPPHAGASHTPPPSGAHTSPWATPQGEQRPTRRRGGPAVWVASAAVAGLLVGGGAVAGLSVTGAIDEGADRAVALSDVGTTENDRVPVSGSSAEDPDWQAVAAAVQDSVVAIDVATQQGGGQGSGVVIDDDGHVLTNDHVVAGAQGNVQVTLTDGRILEGEVVGTDASTDLAVVQLLDPPDDLSAAAFGDSDAVSVGDPVMAVGNPLGLANTATTGIVSAVDRPVSTRGTDGGSGAVTNAIQVDAAINPGNSGGPLFDARGRVIGITSSIATLSQASGSIGLGFAIPVNLARNIASQLIADGQAEHAFLGVTLSDGTATADGVTRRGAVVESVTDGSPAAAASLRAGDVIVAIGDDPVGGAESLTAFVRAMTSGDDATLTVVRDGKAVEVDVTLATRPDEELPSPQQPEDQQGQPGQGEGGGLPGGMTPEELWQWLQERQGQG